MIVELKPSKKSDAKIESISYMARVYSPEKKSWCIYCEYFSQQEEGCKACEEETSRVRVSKPNPKSQPRLTKPKKTKEKGLTSRTAPSMSDPKADPEPTVTRMSVA